MMTIILSVVKAAILGFLAYLVWYDIKYKKVPNKVLLVTSFHHRNNPESRGTPWGFHRRF